MRALHPLVWLLASVLTGCTGFVAPAADYDLRLEAASHAFGGGFDYLFVHSAGPIADDAFIRMSDLAGPSTLSRQLAARLAPGASHSLRMMVSGPNPEKTVRVILDALDIHRGTRLPHLELMYLGESEFAPHVQRAVESIGAKFRFASFAN